MMDFGLVLFNINFAQLVTVLTLTDAIEYGQLNSGQRNEAVVLAVRPMIDKLTGAISNGLVGYIAIAAGMTGSATAADMTGHDIRTFDSMAFYIPLALAVLSIFVFLFKVKLSEEVHAEVVEELKDKLAQGELTNEASTSSTGLKEETIYAPTDGELVAMKEVVDRDGQPFPGKGFAIRPTSDKLYAPFDGKINFTFGTRHAFGITSDRGLEMIVHIGVGTVNMRGEGFNAHYNDGQIVKKGQLLFDFDRELIRQRGYEDWVITFFAQPHNIEATAGFTPGKLIKHGDKVVTVEFK